MAIRPVMRSCAAWPPPSCRPCARTTSRHDSAGRSSWSCCETPRPGSRSRSASASALRSVGSTSASSVSRRSACRSGSRWPSGRTTTSRPCCRSRTRTCTARSAAAATGWSPPRKGPVPATIAAMPRRVARTDPPPPATPVVELDAEEPPLGPGGQPDDPDLEPADADLRDEDETAERELTNGDLARIFHEIGDMLEVKGELRFKTVAYHRAADAIGRSPVDLVAAYREGDPPKIPGVGAAISDKITEIVTTGRMAYYDKLIAEVPPSLVELLRIPGLGPRTVRQIWVELGVLTMDDLRKAAEEGRIRDLRGLSERTEQIILEGIQRLETTPRRMHLHRAEATILGLIEALTDTPGVESIEPAGSFRRRRESIGDLDLLAETGDGPGLIERFTRLGLVDQVLNKGGYKAAIRVLRGPQVDLMVMPPGA